MFRKYVGVITIFLCAVGIILYQPSVTRVLHTLYRQMPIALPLMPMCPDCNVVIISADVLRADDLTCYGYERNTAPNICAFAKKNSFFTRSYSESSYTLDSVFSLLTGLLPSSHHMVTPLDDVLSPDIRTLPMLLKHAGYKTMYVGPTDDINMPLDRGLERGFDEIYSSDTRTNGAWSKRYKELMPTLLGTKPVLMFFHSYAMHDPYLAGEGKRMFVDGVFPHIPVTEEEFRVHSWPFYVSTRADFAHRLETSQTPESIRRNRSIWEKLNEAIILGDLDGAKRVIESLTSYEQFELNNNWYMTKIDTSNHAEIAYFRGLYDERIVQFDTEIKDLLDYVSRQDVKRRTIVVFTSPHGEEFMEHGKLLHDENIYNTSTHVPLIIASPHVKSGVYNELTQGIDIAPTILDMLGLPIPAYMQGYSVSQLVQGNVSYKGRRYVVGEHRGDIIQSISDGNWKLYENIDLTTMKPWTELYQVTADPDEHMNVLETHPDVSQRLRVSLQSILTRAPQFTAQKQGFPSWIDEQKRSKMIQNGYF